MAPPRTSRGALQRYPRTPRTSQGIPKDTKGRPSESFGKFQNSLKNHWFLQYFQLQRHRWMICICFQRSGAPQGIPKTPQGAHNDDQGPQGVPEDAQRLPKSAQQPQRTHQTRPSATQGCLHNWKYNKNQLLFNDFQNQPKRLKETPRSSNGPSRTPEDKPKGS